MKLLAAGVALATLITGTILVVADDEPGRVRPPGLFGGGVELASLRTFEDCGAVEDWFREAAEASNVGGGDVAVEERELAAPTAATDDSAGAGASDGASQRSSAPPDHSGTNLQEEAVDEPDIVKTDGRVIVAVAAGAVRIIDARTGAELARLDAGVDTGGGELLLSGDRLLVIGRHFRQETTRPGIPTPLPSDGDGERVAVDMVMPGQEVTKLTAVDLSDPSAPEILGTAELDGGYVSARLVGDTTRLVLRSYPHVDPAASFEAATILPAIAVDGDEPEPLVPCSAVSHPSVPSGPGITTVVTLDVSGSLEPVDTDTIAADAATIYASTDRLYVGTQAWDGTGGTELHAFDTTAAGATSYVGSGQAPGWMLNQFSLSERNGILRVATTVQSPDGRSTESVLTTFREDGEGLTQLGQVTGLGPEEQIYAVRFIEDVAYVVTFRQTDPLYVLDLADPAAPRVLGELKIPGFSTYLHPIGDGRLLGVGQDANEEGMPLGTQISLFDVRDATRPTRTDNLTFPGAGSPVEHDHKAFLWWPADATAVVPIEVYDQRGASPASGGLVIDVEGDRLVERGRVSHARRPGWAHPFTPPILRSLVVGDAIWTLSEAGLLASDRATLADTVWAPFGS